MLHFLTPSAVGLMIDAGLVEHMYDIQYSYSIWWNIIAAASSASYIHRFDVC